VYEKIHAFIHREDTLIQNKQTCMKVILRALLSALSASGARIAGCLTQTHQDPMGHDDISM